MKATDRMKRRLIRWYYKYTRQGANLRVLDLSEKEPTICTLGEVRDIKPANPTEDKVFTLVSMSNSDIRVSNIDNVALEVPGGIRVAVTARDAETGRIFHALYTLPALIFDGYEKDGKPILHVRQVER